MNWLAKFGLAGRALVYLRAISSSLSVLAANDTERLRREHGPRPVPKRRVEMATLDIAEAERRWERQLSGNVEDE